MARWIRKPDWARTPLGPIKGWPQTLRTAFDVALAMPGPATILWGPAHVQLYNDAYIAVAGDRHPGLLGRPAAEGWPDAYEGVIAPLLNAVRLGQSTELADYPVALLGPDGRLEERVFDTAFSPVRDESGGVAGALQTLVEITGRKRAETALRESEERYSAAFDSMDEGFCVMELVRDGDGEIVDLVLRETNRAFEKNTGLSDMVGRTVGELLPAFESYWIEACSRVAGTGEAVRAENYVRDVDRWYSVFFSLVGGVGSRHVAVLFDD